MKAIRGATPQALHHLNAHVRLVYKDERGEASVSSSVADRTEFWWNERKPNERVLWESKIELGEKFFQEIINHPVPLDITTLTALKRCALGLDLYLWLGCTAPSAFALRSGSLGVRCTASSGRTPTTPAISAPSSTSAAERLPFGPSTRPEAT